MPAAPRSLRSALLRRIAAGLAVVALIAAAVVARRSGVDGPTVQRELMALGYLAPPLFLLVMAAAELLHLPGMFVFIVIARVVFGPIAGLALGYAGAVLAVTLSFVVARQVIAAARSTNEPWRPRWRWVRRALERLEARPVQTTALLRLVLWLAPPLSYALASSNLRVRDHLLGSAIGLAPPVAVVGLLGGYL